MRVGILSMQRILNYGSFMQALSLKKLLESMGHEVCFVDYKIEWPIRVQAYYKTVSLSYLRKLKRKIMHPYNYEKIKRDPRYVYFSPCYRMLNISPKYYFRRKVDVLIIGSDEVFNCLQDSETVGYSLELFGKNNRAKKLISYAASFGDTTLSRLQSYQVDKEIGNLLKRFAALSVRDNNSAMIVQKLCGKIPEQHLDPVLIGDLEKNDWGECNLNNYLIVYGYPYRFTEEEGNEIMAFAKKQKLAVVVLNAEQTFGDKFILCRPDEIFGYFAGANYVITDTFHGTIFAVLFHKPVAIFCRTTKSTNYSNENKLLDMTNKLGLDEQLIRQTGQLEEILFNNIDYDAIDEIRRVERERTISYLKKNVVI